jgi:hypothetical protein
VIARPFIHDERPVLKPCWGIFIIQSYDSLSQGRESAESRPSRKIEGDGILSRVLIFQCCLFALDEIPRNFNDDLTLTKNRNCKGDNFWDELQMDIGKLLAHAVWTHPADIRFIGSVPVYIAV